MTQEEKAIRYYKAFKRANNIYKGAIIYILKVICRILFIPIALIAPLIVILSTFLVPIQMLLFTGKDFDYNNSIPIKLITLGELISKKLEKYLF